MSEPQSENVPLSWLAAYADGELPPGDHARVENWLGDHPEAREIVETQESLGPSNTEFWESVQPPWPTPAQWDQVRNAIAVPIRPRRRWINRIASLAILATAASVALVLSLPERPVTIRPVETEASTTPTVVPLEFASNDDVQIISLPEAATSLLVVGHHPLQGSTMALARFGEVEFLGVGSDIAGRFPERPNDANTEEIPIVWAPREP